MKTVGWRQRKLYAEKDEDRWLKTAGIICREGWRKVAEDSGNYMQKMMKTGGLRERELYAENDEDRWLKTEGIICREGRRQLAAGSGNYMKKRWRHLGEDSGNYMQRTMKTGGWRQREFQTNRATSKKQNTTTSVRHNQSVAWTITLVFEPIHIHLKQRVAKHINKTTPHCTAANIWNYPLRVHPRHTSAPPVDKRHKQLATPGESHSFRRCVLLRGSRD